MITNRISGCIAGWMIGDALGATFEFMTREEATKKMSNLNNLLDGLKGGGPFNFAPGQFTDDTEMGLCAMCIVDKYNVYDIGQVASMYNYWYKSNPKDIGTSTRNTVKYKLSTEMIAAAKNDNSGSLSNGFLMRMPGYVALMKKRNKTKKEIATASILDTKLTHSHLETFHLAVIYSQILSNAIDGLSANDIFTWLKGVIRDSKVKSELIVSIVQSIEKNQDYIMYNNTKYLYSDLDHKYIGFSGYSIWIAIKAMLEFTSYDRAMIYVASLGGDTDTNCCITGAIIGALYPETISNIWLDSLIKCKTDRHREFILSDPNNWIKYIN